ncbi:hypothetical protein Scep_004666 [Stephania cephalantha]|uniref:Uncharacterized protein n=1 Tax=Stephania cephalantha TaxID=152367 RepID=A0AAP0PVL1_9MAGN
MVFIDSPALQSPLDPLLSLTVILSLTVTISLIMTLSSPFPPPPPRQAHRSAPLNRPPPLLPSSSASAAPPIRASESATPPIRLRLCHRLRLDSHLLLDLGFMRIELTQSQPDTPIDETELYLSIVERDDKERTYGLGWTPSGSRRRHATAGGAGGGDGAGSSRPISSPNEPVELLRRDFQAMQTQFFGLCRITI